MAALDEGSNAEAALQAFRAAFKVYKAAIHQELRAELDAASAVKTWVCMCRLDSHKEGEVIRLMPERLKYVAANGAHVRSAGALSDSSLLPQVLSPPRLETRKGAGRLQNLTVSTLSLDLCVPVVPTLCSAQPHTRTLVSMYQRFLFEPVRFWAAGGRC